MFSEKTTAKLKVCLSAVLLVFVFAISACAFENAPFNTVNVNAVLPYQFRVYYPPSASQGNRTSGYYKYIIVNLSSADMNIGLAVPSTQPAISSESLRGVNR